MDVGFISTPFFCICLDLSAPLALVILTTLPFENAFLASPRVSNLAHVQHVLLTSFQVRFLLDFVIFLRPCGVPFGIIFEKKTRSKSASKKEGSPLENKSLWQCPGAPRDAASYYSL